jgi:hypothetical protein
LVTEGSPLRYFTLEEANRLLPWLQKLFEGIDLLRERIAEREMAVSELARQGRQNGGSKVENNIKEQREAIDSMTADLLGETDKIQKEGILLRDPRRGLVDFPSLREGQEVYLCWCWVEDGGWITHWHSIDSGYVGRQPI